MTSQTPEHQGSDAKRLGLLARIGRIAGAILVSGGLITGATTTAVDYTLPPREPALVCNLAHQNSVIAATEGAPEAEAVEYGVIPPLPHSYLDSLPRKPPGGECPGDPAIVRATLQEMQAKKELPPGFSPPAAPNS
jgi:hypothetical protein